MDQLISLDKKIFEAINHAHFPVMDYFMYFVSLVGELAIIWFFLGVLVLYKNKKEGKKILILMTLAIILTVLINHTVVSYFFFRLRPYLALPGVHQLGKQWMDSSFPSGHVSSAMAATVILGRYYRKYLAWMMLFVILTMYSRVYLGMHYPSDVLAGVAVGLISGCGIIYLYKIFFGKMP